MRPDQGAVPPPYPPPFFTDPERRARLGDACARVAPFFHELAAVCKAPGLAFGVVLDGELIEPTCLGVRDVAGGAPVEPESYFRIASMTKSFVALAVMQLRDQGRLRLDEPAATYVPELAALAYPTADSPILTLRRLLAMDAGLPQDDPWADRQLFRSDAWLSELFRRGFTWSNPPGVGFEYSNLAYMLLGRVVANVSGLPVTDYISRHILQPLGMHQTVWNPQDVPADRLAQGYQWLDGEWHRLELLPAGGDVAAFAGLFTTLPDLARWVGLFQRAWLPGEDAADALLRRSSLREMQRVWTAYGPGVVYGELGARPAAFAGGYGCGLSVQWHGAWESVGHGGGLPGFGSHMRWAPAYGVGVIALANGTYAGVGRACAAALQQLVDTAGIAPLRVQPAPALLAAQRDVNQLLAAWDDALADRLFSDNFFLDLDRAHWQAELADLRRIHGALRPAGKIAPENWLRGTWKLDGERGACSVWISLTPTVSPRVQALELESILPLAPVAQTTVEALAAVVTHPTRRALDRLLARAADRMQIWERVQLAHLLCGASTAGELISGDGLTQARVIFVGSKGRSDVELVFDDRGKLRDARFYWPPTDAAQ